MCVETKVRTSGTSGHMVALTAAVRNGSGSISVTGSMLPVCVSLCHCALQDYAAGWTMRRSSR